MRRPINLMQTVILGNGFDRACGLPTSYQDFFSWRFDILKKKINIEDDWQSIKDKLDVPTQIDDSYNSETDDILMFLFITIDDKKESYRHIYDGIMSLMHKYVEWDVNIWDLYFIINKKENDPCWYEIENKIEKVVKNVNLFYISKTENIMQTFANDGNHLLWHGIPRKKIEDYFLLSLFLESKYKGSDLNIYELLLQELKLFEKNLNKYFSIICETLKANDEYKKEYAENFIDLLGNNKPAYVLNFNYTGVNKYSNDVLSYIQENNVHGRAGAKTILGIDQRGCNTKTEEYIFSKTYRKLTENLECIPFQPIFNLEDDDYELIFYGHSLSRADYSYFQSLFDMYDLYNHSKLIFKYSIYAGKDKNKIRGDVFNNIFQLLSDYGSTMDNKDHGNNLLHKLLLEGRISVQEIELKRISFVLNKNTPVE